jgi:hypothetical protein
MRQTGTNGEGSKIRTTRGSSSKATKGIMPESYAGTVKEGPVRRIFDRLVG